MKFISVIIVLILTSCTSANLPNNKTVNEFVQMNEIWQNKLSKNEIAKYFGPHFKNILEGISYNYDNTDFTKMAFFFDKNEKLIDQFAIVGPQELSNFKSSVPCKWTEKKTQLKDEHVIKIAESGECPQQHIKYFFRKDLGFYEIRWHK